MKVKTRWNTIKRNNSWDRLGSSLCHHLSYLFFQQVLLKCCPKCNLLRKNDERSGGLNHTFHLLASLSAYITIMNTNIQSEDAGSGSWIMKPCSDSLPRQTWRESAQSFTKSQPAGKPKTPSTRARVGQRGVPQPDLTEGTSTITWSIP